MKKTMVFANPGTSTPFLYQPPSHKNHYFPYLTIATPHITIDSEWHIHTILNFDHLPILVQLCVVFLELTSQNLPIAPSPTSIRRIETCSLLRLRNLSLT